MLALRVSFGACFGGRPLPRRVRPGEFERGRRVARQGGGGESTPSPALCKARKYSKNSLLLVLGGRSSGYLVGHKPLAKVIRTNSNAQNGCNQTEESQFLEVPHKMS